MKKQADIQLDFIVDRLTYSIQNTISRDSFPTEIARFTIKDAKQTTKKNGWNFDWKSELDNDINEVYKLTIVGNYDIIQDVVSIRKEADHIFMNLLENSPFNTGRNKLYEGVAGNLVAFACKFSFQFGFDGFVGFTAKTKLIQHYIDTLGAYNFAGRRMLIETHAAKFLVEKYFKT